MQNLKILIEKTTIFFEKNSINNPRYESEKFFSEELRLSRIELYTNYDRPFKEKELLGLRHKLKERVILLQNNHKKTLKTYLTETVKRFTDVAIEEPDLSAAYIFAEVLSCKVIDLKIIEDRNLDPDEIERLSVMIQRRLNHEPIQYILGKCEFYGLDLYTNKSALIPRPETELLVEKVIQIVKNNDITSVLDIGTGSGCIPIAIKYEQAHLSITAIDKSDKALLLAQRNADKHKVEILFKNIDIFTEINNKLGQYDIVVSNPPYVADKDYSKLAKQLTGFEPKIALTDEDDGYRFYRRIAELAEKLVNKNGYVLVETGINQAEDIKAIFIAQNMTYISSVFDYQKIERHLVFGKK